MAYLKSDLYEGNASVGNENLREAETKLGGEIHYFDGETTYCKAHN